MVPVQIAVLFSALHFNYVSQETSKRVSQKLQRFKIKVSMLKLYNKNTVPLHSNYIFKNVIFKNVLLLLFLILFYQQFIVYLLSMYQLFISWATPMRHQKKKLLIISCQ